MKSKAVKIIVTAVALIIIIVGSALTESFLIGKSVVGDEVTFRAMTQGDNMRIFIGTPESAVAFRNPKLKVKNGTAFITAKKVLVSPLFDDGHFEMNIDISETERIVLGETVVWTKDDVK